MRHPKSPQKVKYHLISKSHGKTFDPNGTQRAKLPQRFGARGIELELFTISANWCTYLRQLVYVSPPIGKTIVNPLRVPPALTGAACLLAPSQKE